MNSFIGFQKGINLGGWISQRYEDTDEYYNSFITESDIANIASLGFDHVRVPVDYDLLEDCDGNPLDKGYRYLDLCLSWCQKYNLNMLVDLHECYGYSFDPLKKGMDREKFFFDDALQTRFLELWKRIAQRYSSEQDRVAFEPLNEVVSMNVIKEWNSIVARYIDTMRGIVPGAYLVIGGVCYNSVHTVPLLDFPSDSKTVLNFHCYQPFPFTHQGAYWSPGMPLDFRIGYPRSLSEYIDVCNSLCAEVSDKLLADTDAEMGPAYFESIFSPAIEYAESKGLALYCGEYGVIDLADGEDKLRWLSDIHTAFDAYSIGRALWTYKKRDFGLMDESFAGIKDRFIEIL